MTPGSAGPARWIAASIWLVAPPVALSALIHAVDPDVGGIAGLRDPATLISMGVVAAPLIAMAAACFAAAVRWGWLAGGLVMVTSAATVATTLTVLQTSAASGPLAVVRPVVGGTVLVCAFLAAAVIPAAALGRSGGTRRRQRGGFSLVEILLALAVVGVLATIMLPRGMDRIHRARQSRAMKTMVEIAERAAMKLGATGLYPPDIPAVDGGTAATDPWGHRFLYSSDGTHFELRCLGSDGSQSEGISPATRDRFDLDIVMVDGRFINAPY